MRSALRLLAAVLLAACGSDKLVSPSIEGTYSLRTVNGAPLPVTTSSLLAAPATIATGEVTLAGGRTFTSRLSVRQTVNGVPLSQTLMQAGTFAVSGDRIVFSYDGETTTNAATLRDNTIVVSDDDLTFTFVRR